MNSKIVKSLIMQLHNPLVTCALLGPNMFLSTLLNTLSLCSSLSVRDHVSGSHETTGKIYVFEYIYILLENQGFMCHSNGTNNMIITH